MPRKPGGPAPPRATAGPATVRPADLEVARREALLQLRIGRSAHLFAVGVSALIALDGFLLVLFVPDLPSLASGSHGLAAIGSTFYLLLPIIGGLLISAIGVVSKWEAFQFWPWERHFSLSMGALALNVALVVLYALRISGTGPTGDLPLYPVFLPLALAGIGLAFLGIALTWSPWGARQWASALCAVLPLATTVLVVVPPPEVASASGALAVALLLSAFLYQTSGSFLHLVSSGTGAHERAVVLNGQNRLVRFAEELRQREDATKFREAALVRREADHESLEAAVRRRHEAFADRERQLSALEGAHRIRAEGLASQERNLAGREAAVENRTRLLESRERAASLRAQELAREAPELAAREERLARREGELARHDAELQQRRDELARREASITTGEARVVARRKEVDQKTAELLRREGEVAAREAALGPSGSRGPRPPAAPQELAAREARLQHLKNLLDEQNAELGKRAKEVADQARAADAAARQATERQAHLVARESALSQREEDLADRLKAADERRLGFENALRDYQHRLEELGRQEVSVAQHKADLERGLRTLADRDQTLLARERTLSTSNADVDRRESTVLARERALEAREAELSLRHQELEEERDLPMAGLLAVAEAERRAPATDAGGSGTVRAPSSSRAAPAPTPADPTATGTLAPPGARRYADRLPTGIPRLDDLLLGGLPARSHVVLVGDAFVGKEVALYAFIAEGLKRSEPAVLVTAARSAREVAENLGVVLPQFHQYEQLGKVTWIDASGAGATDGPRHLVAKGSDDRDGILALLAKAAETATLPDRPGSFRVGVLGLSAILAHTDERASFSFLQNLVGVLKPRPALAMYALEAGALSDAQVESLLGRMDGAIVFRQDRDRTFLSVKGFGDVATRDWVECRATNRSLIVGSFALERIR